MAARRAGRCLLALAAGLGRLASAGRHLPGDVLLGLRSEHEPAVRPPQKLWRASPGLTDAAAKCDFMPSGNGMRCSFKSECGLWRWIGIEVGAPVCRIKVGVGRDFELTVLSKANAVACKALWRLRSEFDEAHYRDLLAKLRSSMEAVVSQLLGFATVAALADTNCSLQHRDVSIMFRARELRGPGGELQVDARFHKGATHFWSRLFGAKEDDVIHIILPPNRQASVGDECLSIREALLTAWRRLADENTARLAGLLTTAGHRVEKLREELGKDEAESRWLEEASDLLQTIGGADDASAAATIAASLARGWAEELPGPRARPIDALVAGWVEAYPNPVAHVLSDLSTMTMSSLSTQGSGGGGDAPLPADAGGREE